jgi:NAD(P)-dependent dehydrogenase (short-subunit alcohol dehydrogenase family)
MRIPRPIGGKVVVITGAARGIGAALAVRLAAAGARVALIGLEPEQLREVAGRCGPNAAWWECDVTDAAALALVAQGVKERFSRVDVLVSNAGIAAGCTLLLSEAASFDRVIEVNLLGSIRTVRAFLPLLIAAEGYYLQIASLAALTPAPMISAYVASKAGVEAFAQSLRTEVAHHGVDVGVAYLSFTDTDMTKQLFAERRAGGMAWSGQKDLRRRRLGPVGNLHDLGGAVNRLAAGIERRAPFVYGQPFIRWVRPARGLLPSLIHAISRHGVASAEAEMAERGAEASLPVGAGGQADSTARGRRA